MLEKNSRKEKNVKNIWRKIGIGTLSTVMCMGTVLGGSSMSVFADEELEDYGIEPRHFVISNGFQEGHQWGTYMPQLLDLITEASGGAYTYDYYPGGEILTIGGEYDALMDGSIDIAFSFQSFTDARFPYSQVTVLPLSKIDHEQATQCFKDLHWSEDPISEAGENYMEMTFGNKDLFVLEAPICDNIKIATTFDAPLDSADAFNKELTVRTSSSIANILCEDLGITGLTVPASEIYDVMSRNACKGIIINSAFIDNGIQDLVGNVYETSLGIYATAFACTKETWDSLDEGFKERFLEGYFELFEQDVWAPTVEKDKEYLTNNGANWYTWDEMPDDVKAKIEEASTQCWIDWIEQMEADGNTDARACALYWRDILVKNGVEIPEGVKDLE